MEFHFAVDKWGQLPDNAYQVVWKKVRGGKTTGSSRRITILTSILMER
jgi:hypothetical protein